MRIIYLMLTALLLLGALQVSKAEDRKEKKALTVDGPYVLHEKSGALRVIGVDEMGRVTDSVCGSRDVLFNVVSEKGNHRFQVALHPFERQKWKTKRFDKSFVLSDLHGDMTAFVTILRAAGVINEQYEWIYGENQLVVIGDVFDRGKDVLPIFWLIYKLEAEAQKAGGQVSFLLGNHEEMVLRGNLKYVKDKYKYLAEELKMPHQALWTAESELGRWLRTRNTIQVTGADLFVHAGLSNLVLRKGVDVDKINKEVSAWLGVNKEERRESKEADLLFGSSGMLWYRGMVRKDDKYNPLADADMARILKKMRVQRVIVGHTIFDDITSFYNGRVIAVNMKHEDNLKDKRGLAVEIVNGVVYEFFESGERRLFKW